MAKEITPMNQVTADIKSVSRTLGSRLASRGFKVPHTELLNALAAALNKRDWQTLLASVKGKPQPMEAPTAAPAARMEDEPTPWMVGHLINATFHSADGQTEVKFDARRYFAQARVSNIVDLLGTNFSDSFPADAVATFMEQYNTQLRDAFDSLAGTIANERPGFTARFSCSVNAWDAIDWLASQRWSILAPALCKHYDRNPADYGETSASKTAVRFGLYEQARSDFGK